MAAFATWAAQQRAESAAAGRARERSLREQAAATATWIGILVDLAEQGTRVTTLVAGQRRSGRIVGVGRDFLVLDPRYGHTTLICLDAVSTLWSDPTAAAVAPAGSRGGAIDLSLLSALALLAEQRSPVSLTMGAGLETAGDLVAVGEDVLTIRTEPPSRRLAYVPISAVALCDLR